MWCAMGQCYENEQLGMDAAAIRCYRRALLNQEREGIALHKLVPPCPSPPARRTPASSTSCSAAAAAGRAVLSSELLVQALLHQRRSEPGEAAHYFSLNLQRIDEQGSAGQDAVEALQFLGQHSMVRP